MWWWLGVLAVAMLAVGIGLILWWALDPRARRTPDSEAGFLSDQQIGDIDQRYRA